MSVSKSVEAATPQLDSSQILVEIQLKLIYFFELSFVFVKRSISKLLHKCFNFLYSIYVDSALYSFVFRFKTYFLNNTLRRKRLLEWLHSKLKPPFSPTNFTTDWRDGVRLCALCETLVPGSCPRYDLLNPLYHHNNLHLALNLFRTYLHIKTNITEQEIFDCSNEAKLVHLLSQIKLAHAKMVIKSTGTSLLKMSQKMAVTSKGTNSQSQYFHLMDKFFHQCFIKGMGIVSGVRGRRALFSIYYGKPTPKFNLVFEIKGPNGSCCSENVVIGYDRGKEQSQSSQQRSYDQIAQNLIMRAAMKTNAKDRNLKIPLFYELLSDHVLVTYIPLFAGEHRISLIWQGRNVLKSPYMAMIEETEYLDSEISDVGLKFLPGLQYPMCLTNSDKKFEHDEMGTVIRRKIVKETIVSNQREYDYANYFKSNFSPTSLNYTKSTKLSDKPIPKVKISSPDESFPALTSSSSELPKDLTKSKTTDLSNVFRSTAESDLPTSPQSASASNNNQRIESFSVKTKAKLVVRNASCDENNLRNSTHKSNMLNIDSKDMKLSWKSSPNIANNSQMHNYTDEKGQSVSYIPSIKQMLEENNEKFAENILQMKKGLEQKLNRCKKSSTS